ncbi:type II toxin-antitoxin system PemK/MazF family toxin [Sediminivirga luteola]|uniref:mRNA interferase MazF n=1 Tax=Sediminivirga luteola TaxID=1774748 RepID=A0A8J2U069_9MICO|nr:type II toxin-antitoxin system PemK/MazF family toxin [Sediminivirga luteola]GGA23367.1 hypothetical protein GCM10011333_27980 [Sediminivirga luteola]
MATEGRLAPGEIWWAWMGEPEGREQGGRRPVVVISGPTYLRTVDTLVMVAPITTTSRGWLNHTPIEGDTSVAGYAMSEQARTVSRSRLKTRAGRVSPACLAKIRRWVWDFLVE